MVKTSTVGIVLLLLGALAFVYVGFNYSRREKVLDAGSIHITVDNNEQSFVPTAFGILALVGGIAFIIGGARKSP